MTEQKIMTEQELMTKFIQNRTANGLSTATLDSYCYALRDYLQYLLRNNVTTVDSSTIENYFIYLRSKRYSQVTLRDKYAILHAYYTYAVQQGYYSNLPIQIKKPKLPTEKARCFSETEICKIMQYFAVRDTFTKIRDYAIICLLLGTGVRRSELLSITDIQPAGIVVMGKGNKQRFVPILGVLKGVLKEYIAERNKIAMCPYLIVTRDGRQMTKNGLRAVFTRLSNATGIGGRRFSPHSFRHTYATLSIRSGMDIATLSAILGHSNLSTTEIYLHYNEDSITEINNRCNPLNNFKLFF